MSKRAFVEFLSHGVGDDGIGETVLTLTSLPKDRTNAFELNIGSTKIQIGKIVDVDKNTTSFGIVTRRQPASSKLRPR